MSSPLGACMSIRHVLDQFEEKEMKSFKTIVFDAFNIKDDKDMVCQLLIRNIQFDTAKSEYKVGFTF